MKYQDTKPKEDPDIRLDIEKGNPTVITPNFENELDTCIVKLPTNDYLYSSASTKDDPLKDIMR